MTHAGNRWNGALIMSAFTIMKATNEWSAAVRDALRYGAPLEITPSLAKVAARVPVQMAPLPDMTDATPPGWRRVNIREEFPDLRDDGAVYYPDSMTTESRTHGVFIIAPRQLAVIAGAEQRCITSHQEAVQKMYRPGYAYAVIGAHADIKSICAVGVFKRVLN